MKFLKVAMVLAVALCLTASVYAETQSVKVSGDLTVRGIGRNAYDFRNSNPKATPVAGVTALGFAPDSTSVNGGLQPNSHQTFWMSQAEVQIDADLTDNVSTVIRIFNERDWNVQTRNTGAGNAVMPNGLQTGFLTPQDNEFNVQLDLAYVTLKNFVYCPLTVTIGRQDLWFGKGFIVGSNQVNNNYQQLSAVNGGLNAPEYTTQNAFDSVKATLDYDPWTITGVWASTWNNAVSLDDGQDLWGVNIGYKFDCYKAEAEAYWFLKRDRTVQSFSLQADQSNDVNTIGIRGSMDPIDSVTIAGEVAGQFGAMTQNTNQFFTRERAAWALDVSAEYRGLMDCWAWKPKGAVEYILYSGDSSADQLQNNQEGTYTGWDRMFRGKYDSAIREWTGTYYASYAYTPQAQRNPTCEDASYTNQSQVIFSGTLQPMDCLTLKGNYNLFWSLQSYMQIAGVASAGNTTDTNHGNFIGQEIDMQAIWDYTEDVSFGLLMAYFMPNGDTYYGGNNDVASDIVGTVKVSF